MSQVVQLAAGGQEQQQGLVAERIRAAFPHHAATNTRGKISHCWLTFQTYYGFGYFPTGFDF